MSETRLHLGIFLPSLRGGGAERVMLALANGYAERGHRVDLLLVEAAGPYLSDVGAGVRLLDLAAGRTRQSLRPFRRYLREEQPDLVISAMPHINVIAVIGRALSGRGRTTRLVVSEHNDVVASAGQPSSRSPRKLAVGIAYRRADAVVAVSEGVAQSCTEAYTLPRRQLKVVYNPIVVPALDIRAETTVPQHRNLSHMFVAAGRLIPQKDFATLLRAFVIVRQKCDAQLVILGEGELRDDLERQAASSGVQEFVRFPGFVTNPFAYMRSASAFVLSSAWEGFGNVLVEAMAVGTPVVSTDCPSGPREILEDGHWGRLVPVADADALADAILATLADRDPPDVRFRAAYFSLDRALDGYLAAAGYTR